MRELVLFLFWFKLFLFLCLVLLFDLLSLRAPCDKDLRISCRHCKMVPRMEVWPLAPRSRKISEEYL